MSAPSLGVDDFPSAYISDDEGERDGDGNIFTPISLNTDGDDDVSEPVAVRICSLWQVEFTLTTLFHRKTVFTSGPPSGTFC